MDLVAVSLCLRSLPHDNAGAGFLGFLDFMGESLNPHGHPKGRFLSWWTHFSLLLEYSNGERWKLERTEHGVVHERLDDYWSNDEDSMGTPTFVWHGIRNSDIVEHFVKDQRQYPYMLDGKNCQHFAYDFFRCCLDDKRAHGSFERFTEHSQSLYRAAH